MPLAPVPHAQSLEIHIPLYHGCLVIALCETLIVSMFGLALRSHSRCLDSILPIALAYILLLVAQPA